VEDEIRASIERKHQASLDTKEGRASAGKDAARQEARAKRKLEQTGVDTQSLEASQPNEHLASRRQRAKQGKLLLQELTPSSPSMPTQPPSTSAVQRKVAETNARKKHELKADKREPREKELRFLRYNHEASGKKHEVSANGTVETGGAVPTFQDTRLAEIQRKREELERKKKLLAEKTAELQAKKQKVAPVRAPKPDATISGQKFQDSEALTNQFFINSHRPKHLETESLRLYLPGGKLIIDEELTVDLNAPTASLRSQISALQARLNSSYPRLDDLPFSLSNALSANRQDILKTWLKILVSRWQAKTGDTNGPADKQLKRVLDHMVNDHNLSNEAAERMAKRWVDAFPHKRTSGQLDQAEDQVVDDYDEMGFLRDEPDIDDERAAMYDARSAPASATMPDRSESMVELNEENSVGLSDDEVDAFLNTFNGSGAKRSGPTSRSIAQNQSTQQVQAEKQMQGLPGSTVDQKTVVLSDGVTVAPVPTEQPDSESPELDAWALHHLRNDEPVDGKKAARDAIEAAAAREGYSISQEAEEIDVDVLNANLQAVELGWGDENDVPAHALPPKKPKLTYAHMKPYNPRSPSALAQFKARGLIPKDFDREYSTSSRLPSNPALTPKEDEKSAQPAQTSAPHLPHLTATGSAHMVSISAKAHTTRTAIAVGTVYFSNPTPLSLITSNSLKKGDVLSVSRIAGIMAAKKCPDIVPLCHPIPLTHVGVELRSFSPSSTTSSSPLDKSQDDLSHGGVQIECKVACTGATGVEMEALTAVMGTALSVVDMCKAVDKFQRIGDVRVVLKEGGKSGVWREESWRSWQDE
jgi:molybdenum cofactor biosynthesis protein MoaC